MSRVNSQFYTLIVKVTFHLHQKLFRTLGKKIIYSYKDFSIELPAGHNLPLFQKLHPQYDNFLPMLVRHIPGSSCVVDVGANVGDTLAGMVEENSSLQYICIEADESFYHLLIKNIRRIKTSNKNLKVDTFHNFVGNTLTNVKLGERMVQSMLFKPPA
jgi:hypothetical protein